MNQNKYSRVRRLVSALLAAVMLTSSVFFFRGEVYAASDRTGEFENDSNVKKQQKKIAELEKRAAEIKKEISSLNNDIAGLTQQKDGYESLIEVCEGKIEALTQLIAELEGEEEALGEDIESKKAESAELYERIKARMVIAYESGGARSTYLGLIFGADNVFDFLVGVDNAVRIMEYDTRLLNEYRSLTEKLEERYARQEKNLAEQLEAEKKLEEQQKEAEASLAKCESLMADLQKLVSSKKDDAEKLAEERKEADAKLDAIIEELIKKNGATQNVAEGEYMWPLETRYNRITSYFGPRTDPIDGTPANHGALDIYAPYGAKIYASNNGTVVTSLKSKGSYGNYIIIDHGGNVFTLYAHCSKLLVPEGTYVEKGTVIAEVGVSGRVTGAHLHFEVREGKTRVDPLKYVKRPG